MQKDKMFDKNYFKDYRPTSGFAQDRGSYRHSGIDVVDSRGFKIQNFISGIVWNIDYYKNTWGNKVTVRSYPYYSGGVRESIYADYCHLSKTNVEKNHFVQFGDIVGEMGNTGNCWFWDADKNNYVKVTTKEQINKGLGTHLHFDFYQINKTKRIKLGQTTKFFNELKKLHLLGKQTAGITHFWQWGKIFYSPNIIFSYFKILNEKYNLK